MASSDGSDSRLRAQLVATIEGLEKEDEDVPNTRFPRLDTLDPCVKGRSRTPSNKTELLSLDLPASDHSNSANGSEGSCFDLKSCLERYSRFIIDFTGEEAVSFLCTLNDDMLGIVCGRRPTGELRDLQWKPRLTAVVGHHSGRASDQNFSLSLGSSDPFASSNGVKHAEDIVHKTFILQVSHNDSLASYKVWYKPNAIPNAAAVSLVDSLTSYLLGTTVRTEESIGATKEVDKSILNFPLTANVMAAKSNGHVHDNYLLHHAFYIQASENPDQTALDFLYQFSTSKNGSQRKTFTYGELDSISDVLARHIVKLLPARESTKKQYIIPVYCSTSPDLYISYLGILKAGCAFCPLPPDAPELRLRSIFDDICPLVALGNGPEPTTGSWVGATCTYNPAWIDVGGIAKNTLVELAAGELTTGEAILPDISTDDLAYVLYTSGSTGRPKGVQITHSAIFCSINAHMSMIPSIGNDQPPFRWFQFAASTFDPSIMEIFVTLSAGGTLCSATRDVALADLEATVTELKATIMMATPSLASLLRPERVPTLKCLWTMGEPLNRKTINNFAGNDRERASNGVNKTNATCKTTLLNAYGPTEAAINCTHYPDFPINTRGTIIGYPMQTCSIFIIGAYLTQPTVVPLGFAGELAIGGPHLSPGYLNRSKQNEISFVTLPSLGRLYRTGDRARVVWSPEGTRMLEFLGRTTDDQVKINGKRVELGEIESVISQVSGVQEVAVIVLSHTSGTRTNEVVTACIVANNLVSDDQHALEKRCQDHAAKTLSVYMCPSRYIFLRSIPKSISGKLERATLMAHVRSTAPSQTSASNGYDQIKRSNGASTSHEDTALAAMLTEIFSSTIGIDSSSFSETADIFRWGLDSLTAMQILQKAKDLGILDLSLGDVMNAQSIERLCSLVETRRLKQKTWDGTQTLSSAVPRITEFQEFEDRWIHTFQRELGLGLKDIESILPTTATQSKLLLSLLHNSIMSQSSVKLYINHTYYNVKSNTSIEKLKEAWNTVLLRHEIYRTVFIQVDDNFAPFAQCILPPDSSKAQIRWLEIHVDSESYEIFHSVASEAESSMGLDRPPLIMSIIRSIHGTSVMISLLHVLFDFGSLELLLQEVMREYLGQPQPNRSSLTTAVESYFSGITADSDQHWISQLEGYSPVTFPCLTGLRPESFSRVFKTVTVPTSINLSALQQLARMLKSSSLSIVQAAWSSVLLAYTGAQTRDIVFGSVLSNRFDRTTEVCMAPTFTVVPIRVQINSEQTGNFYSTAEVLARLTEDNVSARLYLDTSLGLKLTTTGKLPYDTTLAFQVFGTMADHSLWEKADALPMAHDYAVMVEVLPDPNGLLCLKATFTDEYLDERSAAIMLTQLEDVISWILHNPKNKFSEASGAVHRDRLSILNPNPCIVPAQDDEFPFIHSQFERYAQTSPHDIALLFKYDLGQENDLNIKWTYSELNRRSSTLAKFLTTEFGSMTGLPIPIFMEKSPALYLTILGILKAGAAWCPIDPLSPAPRRRDLVVRSGAKIMLVAQAASTIDPGGIPTGVQVVDVTAFTEGSIASAQGEDAATSSYHSTPTTPSNMAYLIWTSGTTGSPKGVPISHQAAVTSMRALQKDVPPITRSGGPVRCMQFSQHTFDVFVQDLFYTWGVGGVLISSTRGLMVGSFSQLTISTNATHAHLTPAFGAGLSRASCPTLEVVTMIGEKLPQHVADDWGENMKAYNTYGPAEVTVVSTLKKFGGRDETIKSSNIGWPLSSVSCYVMRDGHIVMMNGVGELALGGHQLADGYWQDPQKTYEKFVWNEQIGERVYLTGDIVRLLADGTLEFIGREDDLIKLNGIRVELSEISFAIRDCHAAVDQTETAFLNRHDRPTKVVVTFLSASRISTDEQRGSILLTDADAADIVIAARRKAEDSLPEFMMPSVFLVLSRIPKTPSAKVDRKALQAAYESLDLDVWESKTNPGAHTTASQEQFQWTDRETDVLHIVSSLSGVSIGSITRSSYLPAIGIDSLVSGRLASRLNSAGYATTLSDVLRARTIRDLLLTTMGMGNLTMVTEATFDLNGFNEKWQMPLREAGVLGEFFVAPATMLQDGLIGESMSESTMYWSNHFFHLPQNTDLERLRNAWQGVSDHTDAMRLGFIAAADVGDSDDRAGTGSTFLQLIYKSYSVDWAETSVGSEDMRHLAKMAAVAAADNRQQNAFRRPPWAVNIFQTIENITMMVSLHHALHDLTSFEYIFQDVWAGYHSKDHEKRHQLRDFLAFSTSDASNTGKENIEFWTEHLRDFADPETMSWPDLTGEREYLQDKSEKALITETLNLGMRESELNKVAQELSTSSNAIIRAAWGSLLLDYLETSVLVFGETISERVFYPDISDAIAPMLSVVPVLFSRRSTARELIMDQEELTAACRAHRHIPASLIRRLLERPQSQPLYPAVFVYHPSEMLVDGEGENRWKESEDLLGLNVEHPLALNVTKGSGGWVLEISAENTFMKRGHLELLVKQLDTLIAAMARNPDAEIIGLLNREDPALISIAESRITSVPANHPSLLYSTYWVERHAKEHPDWHAVQVTQEIVDGATDIVSWTYAVLNSEANKIAMYISNAKLRNKMIAMCAGRTLTSFAIILGILKSGNTYLPIDDKLPEVRKCLLLSDSHAVMLFTDAGCASLFANIPEGCAVVDLDNPTTVHEIDQLDGKEDVKLYDPNDNAYLLYTSGSTGKPKGVLVGHKNLVGFIEGIGEFIGHCSPRTHSAAGYGKWLNLASRAFDVHFKEMFLAWKLGLAAVTAPREALLDDLRLALNELKVTHACFVPSLLEQAALEPRHAPNLLYISVGGEKITKRVLETWSCDLLVVNAYGPTEATIGCCGSMVNPRSNMRNIGRPFGNTTAHVLVPGTFHYAKRGQSGELCITGDLVANGYFERPDAKGFIADFQGQRMYRTGDIVRMLANDTLEFLGRSDDQTKIRGQRIELGEVSESIRSSSSDSIDVTTLLVSHPDISRPQLTSFISQSTTREKRYGVKPRILEHDLRTWSPQVQKSCRKQLPVFMVPDYVIPVDILPLAQVSGKADAKTLKALFAATPLATLLGSAAGSSSSSSPSRGLNETEFDICKAIKSVIRVNVSNLQPTTNIFELGIDSLSAIGLSIKLKKQGFECSVPAVLSHPTIADLASLPKANSNSRHAETVSRALQEFETSVDRSNLSENQLKNLEYIRPCLPLQEGIVALTLNSESEGLYINHIGLEIQEPVDLVQFRNAWIETIKSTPILRTCFAQCGRDIVQLIMKPAQVPDFRGERSLIPKDMALKEFKVDQASISKDIVDNIGDIPPLRLRLMRHPECSLLFISMHHSLYDGESFDMVLKDVYNRYQGMPVSALPSPDNLLGYLASQDSSRQESFWRGYLHKCRPTAVSDASRNIKGTIYETKMLNVTYTKLSSLASDFKVAPPTILQTIFGIAIAQSVGRDDTLFGLLLSGRTVPVDGAEKIVAPCITTIPQRLRLDEGTVSLRDIITNAQRSTIECLEFQHTPLRKINRWANAEKPLFDCLVSYTRVREDPDYKNLWRVLKSNMLLDYPFAVEFESRQDSNHIVANCTFVPELTQKAHSILERVDIILGALCKGEQLTVGDVGIVDSENPVDTEAIHWDETQWSSEDGKIKNVLAKMCEIDETIITKNVSFFRLGIDSISAIRFAHDLRAAGSRVLSSDIMRYTSIGALSNHLREAQGTTSANIRNILSSDTMAMPDLHAKLQATVDSGGLEAAYPCTPLQTGMITGTIASGGSLYVHHHAIKLKSYNTTKAGMLQVAWKSLLDSCDILRTSFECLAEHGSQWIAKVHKTFPDEREAYRYSSGRSSPAEYIHDSTKDPMFDTEDKLRKPPVLAHIYHSEPLDEAIMVLSLHHALYDGLSIPLLFTELFMRFRNLEALNLEYPPRAPFYEAAKLINKNQTASTNFWAETLRDYMTIRLPGIKGPSSPDMTLVERPSKISVQHAVAQCKVIDVTLQSAALLAFGKALSSLVGRRDVVFGHVIAGRSLQLEDCENIIGPFFNTVPFRLKLDKSLQTNEAAARDVQSFTSDAQSHQHAPLQHVQNAWRRSNPGHGTSLFDALFLFQKVPGQTTTTDDLWEPYESDEGEIIRSEYRLNFEIERRPDQIFLRSSCHGNCLLQEGLSDFVNEVEATLQDILESPGRYATADPEKLSSLPIISSRSNKEIKPNHEFREDREFKIIRRILAQISGVPLENISADTSIYAIGLDSITAIRVASSCRSEKVNASVIDILQGETLGGICARLQSKPIDGAIRKPTIALSYQDIRDPVVLMEQVQNTLPCLSGQAYHLASWLQSGRIVYEINWTYMTKESLDIDRLTKAWKELQERHPILRTTFAMSKSGEPVQVILKEPSEKPISLERIESASNLEETVKNQIRKISMRPSDLSSPPVHLHLVTDPNRDVILLTIHHALYDAYSISQIISDLSELYSGTSLTPLPSFSDFVVSTLQPHDPKSGSPEEYWSKRLKDYDTTILYPPATHQFPVAAPSQHFVSVPGIIKNLHAIEATLRGTSITIPTLLILSFSRALARLTSVKNPIFGLYQSGRSSSFPDIEIVPGPTLNLTPIVIPNALTGTTKALASHIRNDLISRIPYEQDSLLEIYKYANLGDGNTAVFNTYLNILWNVPTQQQQSTDSTFFEIFKVGVPSEFTSKVRLDGVTTIDGLTWPIANEGLFVDFAVSNDGGNVDAGVRVEARLLSSEEIEGIVKGVGEDVMGMVEEVEEVGGLDLLERGEMG